jgi:hypothetical protein
VAEKIAASLRESGQLQGYKIGVKYQDGTVWLRGRVSSREQMNAAMKVVFAVPGVSRVVNDLSIADEAGQSLESAAAAPVPQLIPAGQVGRADRVAATFAPAAAQRTAMTVQEPTMALPLDEGGEPIRTAAAPSRPIPIGYVQENGAPVPIAQSAPAAQYVAPVQGGAAPVRYDQPHLPNYAWPSYAAHPNYAGLTYPKQYSPTAWPYIGPFYPYPQVPLGWRKVTLEWHDGWWHLDFDDGPRRGSFLSGLFRPCR